METWPIIIRVPKSAVELTVKAKVFDNGEIQEYENTFSMMDIISARDDFKAFVGDDDYDAVYTLTEEGEKTPQTMFESEDES